MKGNTIIKMVLCSDWWQKRGSFLALGAIAAGTTALYSKAQLLANPAPPAALPVEPPLDTNALKPGQTPPGVGTSTTISPTQLTIPSLWWVQEQISSTGQFEARFGRELVINWLAYPIANRNPGRVDMVVDRRIWGTLDYFERYQFINSFSAIARSYGYNFRVFDDQAAIVAAYTCNFSSTELFLLELSNNLAGIPVLDQPGTTRTRSPIADQLRCSMAVETGLSAFFRRTSTPLK
jgi:hypothetical protein